MKGEPIQYKQFKIIEEKSKFKGRGSFSCVAVETPKFSSRLELTQHIDKFFKDYEVFSKRAPYRVKEYLKMYSELHTRWLNMPMDKKMKRVFGKRSGPYATTKK